MLTTIDPSVRGKTNDALVIGHLVLMSGVNAENARAVPSVSISQSNETSMERVVEDAKTAFGQGDMHVTIVKDDSALDVVKQNVDRMRTGLMSAAIDDHVIVWKGTVPTLSQKQTAVKLAYMRAQACTVLPMGLSRNQTILRQIPERKMGSFATVYNIDGNDDSFIWSWWLWITVFVISLILITSYGIRKGYKGQPRPNTQQQQQLEVFNSLN